MNKLLHKIVKETLDEQKPKVLYTGVVIDAIEAMKLRREIERAGLNPNDWLVSNTHPVHGNEQLSHHMTVRVGGLKPGDPLRMRLNQNVSLRIVGWGLDNNLGVAAWQVEPPAGLPVKSGVPHVTALLRDTAVKPFKAKKIRIWKKLPKPITVRGTFVEVFPHNVDN